MTEEDLYKDPPQKNANLSYDKKLFEIYKGIEIFKEDETGFYRANFNGKDYDTTYLVSIRDDIDDFINKQPIGTSRKIRKLKYDKKNKDRPSSYKFNRYGETKSNFEILLICYLYLQGFTYLLSIPKWFLSLSMDTSFWFGFKGLIFALLPVVSIFYAADWYGFILNIVGITLDIIITLVKALMGAILNLFD